jgi:hypothetical protein
MITIATAPETPGQKLDRLWAYAQGPRDPRSPEYMRGVRDTLVWLAGGRLYRLENPYPPGTAGSDAWYAGNREGHDLWTASR